MGSRNINTHTQPKMQTRELSEQFVEWRLDRELHEHTHTLKRKFNEKSTYISMSKNLEK